MDEHIEIDNTDQSEESAAADRKILELISLLQRKKKYPTRTRNKIDRLVNRFLNQTKNDVHDMLCDNRIYADGYGGLDCERDTEEEVEAIVRFFPDVFSRRINVGGRDYYPIQLMSWTYGGVSRFRCNLKAVSFIPVLVKLAIEFGVFGEEDRGGLLLLPGTGRIVLGHLMYTDMVYCDRVHHELVDDTYLLVMKKLRQMDYLKQEDIKRYGIFHILCQQSVFAEKRFRFLVEWDPTTLVQPVRRGLVPLHYVAHDLCSTMETFQVVFEYSILYYPNKKGINLLFQKNNIGKTPFQMACKKWGQDEVMKTVKNTLIKCRSHNTGPYNVVDAMLTAAIDENVHLDCVYFLLRREPDVLMKLLSFSSSASLTASGSNGNNCIISNSGIDKDDINDGGSNSDTDNISGNNDLMETTTRNPKKRKINKERKDHK
jgi:hypothetical protein